MIAKIHNRSDVMLITNEVCYDLWESKNSNHTGIST